MAAPDPRFEIWRKIVIIHNRAKALLIYCEEADFNQKSFLQPWNEGRNALEHIVRSMACELGLNDHFAGDRDEYILANLDRALGHEYRAYFDICDWLSIIMRRRIQEALKPFQPYPDIIQAVIPNYYTQVKTDIERLNKKIAAIRSGKDIKGDVLEEIDHYHKVIEQLQGWVDHIEAAIPSLQELKSARDAEQKAEEERKAQELADDDHREEKRSKRTFRNGIIIGIVGTVLAAVLTVVGKRLFPDKPPPIATGSQNSPTATAGPTAGSAVGVKPPAPTKTP